MELLFTASLLAEPVRRSKAEHVRCESVRRVREPVLIFIVNGTNDDVIWNLDVESTAETQCRICLARVE